MNESIEAVLVIIMLFFIAFMFSGEPDLWDIWLQAAKQYSWGCP